MFKAIRTHAFPTLSLKESFLLVSALEEGSPSFGDRKVNNGSGLALWSSATLKGEKARQLTQYLLAVDTLMNYHKSVGLCPPFNEWARSNNAPGGAQPLTDDRNGSNKRLAHTPQAGSKPEVSGRHAIIALMYREGRVLGRNQEFALGMFAASPSKK